jgi:hypothetical protein
MIIKEAIIRSAIRGLLLEAAIDKIIAKSNRSEDEWRQAEKKLNDAKIPPNKQANYLRWLDTRVAKISKEPLRDVIGLVTSFDNYIKSPSKWIDKKRNKLSVDINDYTRNELELAVRVANRGNLNHIATKHSIGTEPLTVIDGWEIYVPYNMDDSIEIANRDKDIPWCTARTDGNNLFYAYALSDIILFYIVDDNELQNKFCIGVKDGQIVGEFDGGSTVDFNNKGFDKYYRYRNFGKDTNDKIENFIKSYSEKLNHIHPGRVVALAAFKDFRLWTQMIKPWSIDNRKGFIDYGFYNQYGVYDDSEKGNYPFRNYQFDPEVIKHIWFKPSFYGLDHKIKDALFHKLISVYGNDYKKIEKLFNEIGWPEKIDAYDKLFEIDEFESKLSKALSDLKEWKSFRLSKSLKTINDILKYIFVLKSSDYVYLIDAIPKELYGFIIINDLNPSLSKELHSEELSFEIFDCYFKKQNEKLNVLFENFDNILKYTQNWNINIRLEFLIWIFNNFIETKNDNLKVSSDVAKKIFVYCNRNKNAAINNSAINYNCHKMAKYFLKDAKLISDPFEDYGSYDLDEFKNQIKNLDAKSIDVFVNSKIDWHCNVKNRHILNYLIINAMDIPINKKTLSKICKNLLEKGGNYYESHARAQRIKRTLQMLIDGPKRNLIYVLNNLDNSALNGLRTMLLTGNDLNISFDLFVLLNRYDNEIRPYGMDVLGINEFMQKYHKNISNIFKDLQSTKEFFDTINLKTALNIIKYWFNKYFIPNVIPINVYKYFLIIIKQLIDPVIYGEFYKAVVNGLIVDYYEHKFLPSISSNDVKNFESLYKKLGSYIIEALLEHYFKEISKSHESSSLPAMSTDVVDFIKSHLGLRNFTSKLDYYVY